MGSVRLSNRQNMTEPLDSRCVPGPQGASNFNMEAPGRASGLGKMESSVL